MRPVPAMHQSCRALCGARPRKACSARQRETFTRYRNGRIRCTTRAAQKDLEGQSEAVPPRCWKRLPQTSLPPLAAVPLRCWKEKAKLRSKKNASKKSAWNFLEVSTTQKKTKHNFSISFLCFLFCSTSQRDGDGNKTS